MHHFDTTTCQGEGEWPHRALPGPGGNLIKCRAWACQPCGSWDAEEGVDRLTGHILLHCWVLTGTAEASREGGDSWKPRVWHADCCSVSRTPAQPRQVTMREVRWALMQDGGQRLDTDGQHGCLG